ncbi:PTS sugar transporter subunit IIB [Fundicoccus culcitae]|uniref:PTS sugar transporter subunit IIB n=1 Tax=Fundicoccus culcitae TaxID=2969821 RepID=A0ABY5P326_9LACT|nr:PTS sugar transporter subunit IIB [Fundicoccus culcitae]UUX33111.1 PTS sugar transporter subunit IIB [Fundicoccus culcitae]
MKEIMLVCNAGMSTSMLVTKMQKASEEQGIETKIWAVSLSEVDENVRNNNIDVILVGPQVKFVVKKYKDTYEPDIKVTDIPMADYGRMDGEKVLQLALTTIG